MLIYSVFVAAFQLKFVYTNWEKKGHKIVYVNMQPFVCCSFVKHQLQLRNYTLYTLLIAT